MRRAKVLAFADRTLGKEADMLDISTSFDGDGATVALGGRLDTNSAPELEEALGGVFAKTHRVTLDLSDLMYISSAGLRVFVWAFKAVSSAEGSFVVENPRPEVREVFEMTGLVDVFEVR